MRLLKIINPENVSDEDAQKFEERTAVRAIVYDEEGKIALLRVHKKNFHKLPGGGVEEGEDLVTALKRECMEELGCKIEVVGEVGEVKEYRKVYNTIQISPCFVAKIVGAKGHPQFTEEELNDKFEILWVTVNEAIALLSQDEPTNVEAKLYIIPRELIFLEVINQQ